MTSQEDYLESLLRGMELNAPEKEKNNDEVQIDEEIHEAEPVFDVNESDFTEAEATSDISEYDDINIDKIFGEANASDETEPVAESVEDIDFDVNSDIESDLGLSLDDDFDIPEPVLADGFDFDSFIKNAEADADKEPEILDENLKSDLFDALNTSDVDALSLLNEDESLDGVGDEYIEEDNSAAEIAALMDYDNEYIPESQRPEKKADKSVKEKKAKKEKAKKEKTPKEKKTDKKEKKGGFSLFKRPKKNKEDLDNFELTEEEIDEEPFMDQFGFAITNEPEVWEDVLPAPEEKKELQSDSDFGFNFDDDFEKITENDFSEEAKERIQNGQENKRTKFTSGKIERITDDNFDPDLFEVPDDFDDEDFDSLGGGIPYGEGVEENGEVAENDDIFSDIDSLLKAQGKSVDDINNVLNSLNDEEEPSVEESAETDIQGEESIDDILSAINSDSFEIEEASENPENLADGALGDDLFASGDLFDFDGDDLIGTDDAGDEAKSSSIIGDLGGFGDLDSIDFGEDDLPSSEGDEDLGSILGVSFDDSDISDDVENLAKKEKKSFWTKLIEFFTEEDPEDESENHGNEDTILSDENAEILADADNAKGKKKKKKGKKGKEEEKPEGDGEEAEDGEESKGKKKKEKKPKKEKKKKAEEEPTKPEKALSIKKIIPIFAICIAICAAIILLAKMSTDYSAKKAAVKAYYENDYQTCYRYLFGKELNESEEIMFNRSECILRARLWVSEYEMYAKLSDPASALDSLIQSVERYPLLLDDAKKCNAVADVDECYNTLLVYLSNVYGLSVEDAHRINAIEDDKDYTKVVARIANGIADISVIDHLNDEFTDDLEMLPDADSSADDINLSIPIGEDDKLSEETEMQQEVFIDNREN